MKLTKGTVLGLELADYDACDPYEIRIEDVGDGITYRWQLGGCSDNGTITVPNSVLRSGTRLLFISQGGVDVDEPETALPPFLFSRDGFSVLAKKKKVAIEVAQLSDHVVLEGKKKFEIEIDGKKKKVDALHAKGSEIDLWVLDDADLPLVLKAEWEDENYITVKSIHGPASAKH